MIDPQALGLETFQMRGEEVVVLCPFHDDSKPSASFNVEKGLFHCFACGASMGAKRVAEELGGTVVGLASLAHLADRREEKEWRPLLYSPLAFDHPYLKKRGITNDEVEAHQIRAVRLGMDDDGIGFPITALDGSVIGLNIRRSTVFGSQARYVTYGEKPALWPAHLFPAERIAYVVEGIISAIKLRRAGIPAFATLGAGSINRAVVALNGRQAIVMFDDDFAGYLGAAKLVAKVGAKALVPGAEYDLLNDAPKIMEVISTRQPTFDLRLLAAFSGDKDRFWRAIRHWTKP